MNKSFGFIGCGNMGGALARAVAKSLGGKNLMFTDTFSQKASTLAEELGGKTADVAEIAQTCDFIFLGVKPQGFESLFSEISPFLQARKDSFVLVSMAAGISISAVETFLGREAGVIRIMPNTPVSVGEGMILYDANAYVSAAQLNDFCTALSMAGRLDRLAEEKIDAASALSGCGPAFIYLFAEALTDGAVQCGLPREQALLYAAQTLHGASKLLLDSGKHPGELKDAVCSPGGTTIEGVRALEEGKFRASAMNAVIAAYEKTLKLKK